MINDVEKEKGIVDDLVQGKDYEIIAMKWEVSERYVQNKASEYRSKGNDIPKQGSKSFKVINLVRYEEV